MQLAISPSLWQSIANEQITDTQAAEQNMFNTPATLSQRITCQVQLRCFGDAWLSTSFSCQEFGRKSANVQTCTCTCTCRDETWSAFDWGNVLGWPRPDERKTSPQEPWNIWEIHAVQHMSSHVCTYHTFWQRSARGMPKKWQFKHPDMECNSLHWKVCKKRKNQQEWWWKTWPVESALRENWNK